MSELKYDNNFAAWLTAAGITPASTPISIEGVIHQILQNLGGGGGSGTVTSVSVASANGLAGTVATATTTPAITLTTSITGVLKGNGTAISAATAGTDYLTPTGSGTGLTGILIAANNLSDVADAGSSRFHLSNPAQSAVAAVAVANVNIAAPGAAVDGYSFLTNDEVLLAGQVTSSQNGIWIWNGASSSLTRPNEFPSSGIVKRGRTVLVTNGNVYANTEWSLAATAAGLTIDTTAQVWTRIGTRLAYSSVTADPNPAVVGVYYHVVLASTGNFTLPSTPVTGSSVRVKNRSTTTTIDIVGTVDANASFTVPPQAANEFVYNGTDWDAN